jgi:hypothetical protein
MRALAVVFLLACGHSSRLVDHSRMSPGEQRGACEETPCGGTGDALQISVGVALIVGVMVAKFWRP